MASAKMCLYVSSADIGVVYGCGLSVECAAALMSCVVGAWWSDGSSAMYTDNDYVGGTDDTAGIPVLVRSCYGGLGECGLLRCVGDVRCRDGADPWTSYLLFYPFESGNDSVRASAAG